MPIHYRLTDEEVEREVQRQASAQTVTLTDAGWAEKRRSVRKSLQLFHGSLGAPKAVLWTYCVAVEAEIRARLALFGPDSEHRVAVYWASFHYAASPITGVSRHPWVEICYLSILEFSRWMESQGEDATRLHTKFQFPTSVTLSLSIEIDTVPVRQLRDAMREETQKKLQQQQTHAQKKRQKWQKRQQKRQQPASSPEPSESSGLPIGAPECSAPLRPPSPLTLSSVAVPEMPTCGAYLGATVPTRQTSVRLIGSPVLAWRRRESAGP